MAIVACLIGLGAGYFGAESANKTPASVQELNANAQKYYPLVKEALQVALFYCPEWAARGEQKIDVGSISVLALELGGLSGTIIANQEACASLSSGTIQFAKEEPNMARFNSYSSPETRHICKEYQERMAEYINAMSSISKHRCLVE